MKNYFLLIGLLFLGLVPKLWAQEYFPVNGISQEKQITIAFTNARIFIDYKTILDQATLIIRDDKVTDVGTTVSIPADALVIDLNGKYIYPSFIDMYSDYGIAATEKPVRKDYPQYEKSAQNALGWNEAIKSDYDAALHFVVDSKNADLLRKTGFGVVMSHQKDGICRGSATLITLQDKNPNKAMLKNQAAACYSFNKGSSPQQYPGSLMGAIALVRQTYYDARWYEAAKIKEKNISLEHWIALQKLPQLFESDDKLNTLRIAKIGEEFGVQYIIKTSGNEYQQIEEIKKLKSKFILPVNFPEAWDLSNPYDAINVSLTALKNWELAPQNPAYFERSGIDFSFTADGLKDKSTMLTQIQKAIKNGLSEQQALKALTETPASFLQISDKAGALRKGMLANFIISSGNIFEKDNIIFENWVQGIKYIVNNYNPHDVRGKYNFQLQNNTYNLQIGGRSDALEFEVFHDTSKQKVNALFQRNELVFQLETNLKSYSCIAYYQNKKFTGTMQLPDGTSQPFTAAFIAPFVAKDTKDTTEKKLTPSGKVVYPFAAFGTTVLPVSEEIVFKNATLWTNEKEGIITQGDLWIKNGKIMGVGKNLTSPSAQVVDATGKHITPGIVDEHSHIAVTGAVNEGAHSVTSEVRIGDVIDSEDINIYRQLAGGVTTSQILHGSANAIGGQAQLIKLRWGKNPEQLKFEGADPFIKFALGENVKQTNWGDKYKIRYPQTRMGVEQIYMDAFTRAKAYEQKTLKKGGEPVRKDLQLDALVEILNKKRFITCHSYQQSEINMLMHVADTFHFKINTFTHILEGYKVADKMKQHGCGASTFADWWAYKYEVIEAIPYNGAIMNNVGLITAFNSDDPEMARRLNQEAAKAIKYGNLSEEEALKLVTLNPAKLLHIDNRVGSLKAGKDADLVLWNDNPLSIYAKPLKTYVDGICYFDINREEQQLKEMKEERYRIIKKMQEEKSKNSLLKKPVLKRKKIQHCNEYELMPFEVE